jgi:hypothetical protein
MSGQLISSSGAQLLMRRFRLYAVAVTGVLLVVSILDGRLWRHPVTSVVPILILVGFWYYFYRRMSDIGLFVDEVFDCETYLQVRRGRLEKMVPLSNISNVEVPRVGVDRIAMHFAIATTLGQQINFIPDNVSQTKSSSLKLAELNRLAADLDARAKRARGIGLA